MMQQAQPPTAPQVALVGLDDLRTMVRTAVSEELAKMQPKASTKRYIYGLQGVADLFQVSKVTARLYKDTFLRDAVVQVGRKIVVDADKAMQLYKAEQNRRAAAQIITRKR